LVNCSKVHFPPSIVVLVIVFETFAVENLTVPLTKMAFSPKV